MPPPSLVVSYNKVIIDINRLENYRNSSLTLEPKYQHLIAEVILLRLFSLIENYIKDVSSKIACASPYRSGNLPTLLHTCTTVNNALKQFENFNRVTPKSPKWTNSRYSIDTIKKIIPATEKVRVELVNFGPFYEEMRKVRNHVAHRSSSTYGNYKIVIISTYGAYLQINTGAFLVSTKRIPIAKIDYYIQVGKIFVNSLSS
ncbi:hypothetical protein IRZ71_15450 [Flavobacterium sp. ANB]|uniref:hypothetical protein n=1 Tax=unclassified Flavobacterium TaxID=196869 RepID=UPI0012BA0F78|nr:MULTISPECIES: hypothetical protein [unclassified Flavobacterium]MBF4517759.1 hypothetical protein [Flavobacterium sp. ANB]MTD70486.1 hypothetical protein [Flavobacterium sp. LC2016-13]